MSGSAVDLDRLTELGVETVQMETPDLDGVLRGKFLAAEKVGAGARSAFCIST